MIQLVTWANLQEGQSWGKGFVPKFKRPCVVLLNGPMGAGKTQLVRWWVEALGGHNASSPTFAVHQQYSVGAQHVDHVDLYRMTSDADLESSGFWDLLDNDQALLFVEWSNRLPMEVWPKDWQKISIDISFELGQPEVRQLKIES